jgi:hypothetical protein
MQELERMAVLSNEAVCSLAVAIAQYFTEGQPALPKNRVESYVITVATEYPTSATPFHLQFIRHGCSGCLAHDSHGQYTRYRTLRASAPPAEYLEELEYSSIFMGIADLTGRHLLTFFMDDPGYRGFASNLSPLEVYKVVDERCRFYAGYNISFFAPLEKLKAKSGIKGLFSRRAKTAPADPQNWHDLMGDEFDEIKRDLGKHGKIR